MCLCVHFVGSYYIVQLCSYIIKLCVSEQYVHCTGDLRSASEADTCYISVICSWYHSDFNGACPSVTAGKHRYLHNTG